MKQDVKNANGGMNRRKFVGMGFGLAATSVLVPVAAQEGIGESRPKPSESPEPSRRRKLGRLEVSAIGLGVQNMTRRYEIQCRNGPK
jgi:hypothetical protein